MTFHGYDRIIDTGNKNKQKILNLTINKLSFWFFEIESLLTGIYQVNLTFTDLPSTNILENIGFFFFLFLMWYLPTVSREIPISNGNGIQSLSF